MPERKTLRTGWTIEEENGIEVMNDHAIARINFNRIEIARIYDGMGREYRSSALDQEENAFNNYLIMMYNLKEKRHIEKLREQIPHYSIMWLEV